MFLRKVNCAIAFKPILLSRALVIHQSIPFSFARLSHYNVVEKPPNKVGLKTRYWGQI